MKRLALLLTAGLTLSACNTLSSPGDLGPLGVSVTDTGSREVAVRTVTPATDTSPEKVTWTTIEGEGVTFTFTTRPGANAYYITGYRVVRETIRAGGETETITDNPRVDKGNLYVTSGYACAARTPTQSCDYGAADAVPANGLPAQLTIYLESGLANLARSTGSDVSQVSDVEFYGVSSTGQPITLTATGIVSRGVIQDGQ